MVGTWPLLLDGAERGTVTASKDGAYTLIRARARYSGALKRVSLYGEAGELPLGVLSPEGEYVSLTRRFTRRELGAFSGGAEYAAESGSGGGGGKAAGAGTGGPAPEEEDTPAAVEGAGEDEARGGAPAPPGGALWYSAPDGTLSRHDGERLLVAFPAENVRVPGWAGGVVRRINGREYVVFPR